MSFGLLRRSELEKRPTRRFEMGKIVVTEFVSLDGVMEDPGGAEGYKYGGWTFEIERGEDGDNFKLEEAFDTDALLLGRRTYEGFAPAWPQRDGDFADKFNSMPKYVVSSTLRDPEWNNSTVLAGDLVQQVSRLRTPPTGTSWFTAAPSSPKP
jgi:dihydrofolate reductase